MHGIVISIKSSYKILFKLSQSLSVCITISIISIIRDKDTTNSDLLKIMTTATELVSQRKL